MFFKARQHFKQISKSLARIYSSNKTTNGETQNVEIPPEPTNCCMSGCANCVWIEYAAKISQLFKDGGEKARGLILDKIQDPNMRAFLESELKSIQQHQNANVTKANNKETSSETKPTDNK